MRLNPNVVHAYRFTAIAYASLNRTEEARQLIRKAQSQGLDGQFFRRTLYMLAVLERDDAAMDQQLALLAKHEGEREKLLWQARTALFKGQWREGKMLLRQAADVGSRASSGPAPDEALIDALFGSCDGARRADRNLPVVSRIVSPAQGIRLPILPDGSLCGGVDAAEQLADELARQHPNATMTTRYNLPILRAAVALRQNEPDRAIEVLRPSSAFERGDGGFDGAVAYLPNYLRGQAYLRQRRSGDAIAEFRKILDYPARNRFLTPLYALTHVALARAWVQGGDLEESRKAYQDFFALWKDADADVPILIEARREYDRLHLK
jgi:tetratricopeptide (TPR) repeat protein